MIIESDVIDINGLNYPKRVTVGTTTVSITTVKTVSRGIQLKADVHNTGDIYIGLNPTAKGAVGDTIGTTGYQLSAGDTIFLPINNPSMLNAVASASGQDLYVWPL